ncbi:MAG: sulfite exporter TauE/SafE family protein [Pseudomonadota bacterium]
MALATFLLVAFVGAFFQTITGFALGMILIALAAGLQLVPIPVLTATASLLSLVNVVLALRTRYVDIDWPFWRWVTLGQVPAIGVGLVLMMQLNANALAWLQLLLGAFVLAGSAGMVRRDATLPRESSRPARLLAGIAGGVCGGMFSASGPVMGWFFYRQPRSIEVLRATLLACFAVTTSVRTLLVGVRGELGEEVLTLTLACAPAVALGTWLGGRYAKAIDAQRLRRGAFALLTAMGLFIIGRALLALFG